MDQAVNHTAFGVEPAGHAIEVSCVAVFVTPPDSPRQEVSNLDEARGEGAAGGAPGPRRP